MLEKDESYEDKRGAVVKNWQKFGSAFIDSSLTWMSCSFGLCRQEKRRGANTEGFLGVVD